MFLYLELTGQMMRNYQTLSLLIISATFFSLTVTTTFAQMPSMTEISGKYTDDKVGLEIIFPDGWSGITMGVPEGSMATVSPDEMTSMNENSPIMSVLTNEKAKSDTPPKSFDQQGKSKCGAPSVIAMTIGDIPATETTMSCTKDDGTVIKLKNISAETTTHWVVVSFMANASDYDQEIDKFDDSVKTLKIQNAVVESKDVTTTDVPEPITIPPVNLQPNVMPVMVGDNKIDLSIQSSSQLTDLKLDEENKKLLFKVAEDNDGLTIIPIGNVLEGEFVITIDGEPSTNFEILDEQGVQTLTLKYPSGSHDVSISGTRVVPEFGSIAILILIVSIVSIILISPKLRLMQKF